ncbi:MULTISPECIES: UDP-N-acetylmuramate:L-alanyl-gamma-D-glutamyl-meso-diaminopimelate ligase [Idiomarina]|uniref:UDP-N-acetylmuramate:L-alanyl-gamma-D-glutamyl- meso-diaminopimelate ligase n=3 Tax=Idiomarinaceae TaxID=267893 RepID=UPI00079403FE|nr:UDP-N-acetylmuramate:L-alanyl-gamma-D-glutamyl-meso-diaminopimelate ligase [Idiomarina sp. T82-3]KXS36137.1 MAG: UDP-N-acetylmuramate: L-alanyl-gamma-D-glutamyl-meso-diaminopimelate ligase [Idiomarina sp. T82-3]
MHIHIIGVCGTFMGGIARLAIELGHQVTGSDQQVYPPMSDQLRALGIDLIEGYRAENIDKTVELVIIGNALSRGNPEVEAVLDQKMSYCSGAQWLHDNVLVQRWVLAVSGTHGKTTTASMLTWILQANGYQPGFLIGGVPGNFDVSAALGKSDFFVIEADEYDTAFFDKRSKFVHYSPNTLVINNLEFDHADIFDTLADIQKQFSHLLRIVPGNGQVIIPDQVDAIEQVITQGCWSDVVRVGKDWHYHANSADASLFNLRRDDNEVAVKLPLVGTHNMQNAVMAMIAAFHVGVLPQQAAEALATFKAPKRRLELLLEHRGIRVFDDFAHHPTAIKTTVEALKKSETGRLVVFLEPRSNTMKSGVHKDALANALADADSINIFAPASIEWDIASAVPNACVFSNTEAMLQHAIDDLVPGDTVVIMSNGGFEGMQNRLVKALQAT